MRITLLQRHYPAINNGRPLCGASRSFLPAPRRLSGGGRCRGLSVAAPVARGSCCSTQRPRATLALLLCASAVALAAVKWDEVGPVLFRLFRGSKAGGLSRRSTPVPSRQQLFRPVVFPLGADLQSALESSPELSSVSAVETVLNTRRRFVRATERAKTSTSLDLAVTRPGVSSVTNMESKIASSCFKQQGKLADQWRGEACFQRARHDLRFVCVACRKSACQR